MPIVEDSLFVTIAEFKEPFAWISPLKERERMVGVVLFKFRKTANTNEENVETSDNLKVELVARCSVQCTM